MWVDASENKDGPLGVYTILDTGASDIMMSILWFDSFIKEFYDVIDTRSGIDTRYPFYEVVDGAAYATCDADYPNLYFLV